MATHPVTSQDIRSLHLTPTPYSSPLRHTFQMVRSTVALLGTEPCISTHCLRENHTAVHAESLRACNSCFPARFLRDSALVLVLASFTTEHPRLCRAACCNHHGCSTEITVPPHSRAALLNPMASTTPCPALTATRWWERVQGEILTALRAMLRTSHLDQKVGAIKPVPEMIEMDAGCRADANALYDHRRRRASPVPDRTSRNTSNRGVSSIRMKSGMYTA